MKKTNTLYYLIGIVLIIYIILFFIIKSSLQLKFGDFFTGLGAVGTISSLIFVYTQILKAEEQFIQSNKPLLLPLTTQFTAFKPPINFLDQDKFVLNKIIEYRLVYDNKIEIKCLKNEALNIRLSILNNKDIKTTQEYLACDINTIINIQMPDEFVLKLSKVDTLQAGIRQGEEYDELTKNLNYILKIEYEDINNNKYSESFEIKIETGMKSLDILRAIVNLNFQEANKY